MIDFNCILVTLTSNYIFFSYKHALDGIMRISREEGPSKLFNGAQWASTRAVAVTIGQLCFYDFIKLNLLKSGYFQDNLTTHFTSSLCAVSYCRFYSKYQFCTFTTSKIFLELIELILEKRLVPRSTFILYPQLCSLYLITFRSVMFNTHTYRDR